LTGDRIEEEPVRSPTWSVAHPTGDSLNAMMLDFKKSLIEQALRRARGKRVEAARLLGITRDALKQHMKSLGLLGLK
jgi:DNA-binding NtrC family response regulator